MGSGDHGVPPVAVDGALHHDRVLDADRRLKRRLRTYARVAYERRDAAEAEFGLHGHVIARVGDDQVDSMLRDRTAQPFGVVVVQAEAVLRQRGVQVVENRRPVGLRGPLSLPRENADGHGCRIRAREGYPLDDCGGHERAPP